MTIKALVRGWLPRTIRPRRILGGPLRGHQIVTSWHDYPAALLGTTERPLLAWFAANAKPGETWLDVGAHYGYTSIALARLVGKTGRVFAFEPVLSTAGYLQQTLALNDLNQVTILPFGLRATEGFQLVRLPSTRGMIDQTITVDSATWYEVAIVTQFDWLWPYLRESNERIHGVKIDVQGMEIEVLRGMAATLQASRPALVVEVHAGVNRSVLLDLLERIGYRREPVAIEPSVDEVVPALADNRSYVFSPR